MNFCVYNTVKLLNVCIAIKDDVSTTRLCSIGSDKPLQTECTLWTREFSMKLSLYLNRSFWSGLENIGRQLVNQRVAPIASKLKLTAKSSKNLNLGIHKKNKWS